MYVCITVYVWVCTKCFLFAFILVKHFCCTAIKSINSLIIRPTDRRTYTFSSQFPHLIKQRTFPLSLSYHMYMNVHVGFAYTETHPRRMTFFTWQISAALLFICESYFRLQFCFSCWLIVLFCLYHSYIVVATLAGDVVVVSLSEFFLR